MTEILYKQYISKYKVVSAHAMKAYKGKRRTATHLNLGNRRS